jgi:hypothetical protein
VRKTSLIAIAGLSTLLSAPLAMGAAAVVGAEAEAIVKVTAVDRKARTVTFRGPNGGEVLMNVPKESQNLDQVKVGSQFKVRYTEAMAIGLNKGGEASASGQGEMKLAPKGGKPGGSVTETAQITGKVESIAKATRTLALRGPGGKVVELKVAPDVKSFDDVAVGDTITVAYARALAMEMVPAESKGAAKAQ